MPRGSIFRLLVAIVIVVMASAFPDPIAAKKKKKKSVDRPPTREELRIVDCKLQPQTRKLGRHLTFLAPRRPIRTTALDCAIRGGEQLVYDRANYETSRAVWLEAAKGGDVQAQYYLGEIYEKGLGTEPDYEEAARWYLKAAEQGNSKAQINLGFLYEKGLGVERDAREAMRWYREASGVSGTILLDSELEAIRQELAEARAALQEAEGTAAELAEQLETKRRELEAERSSSERSEERIESLEGELVALRRAAEQKQSEISRLRDRQTEYSLPPPKIQVFDPERVRGLTEDSTRARMLEGQVEAPAGLAEFLVDGQPAKVDRDGIFEIDIEGTRSITFVAIDLQGQRIEHVYDPRRPRGTRGPELVVSKKQRRVYGSYRGLVISNSRYEYLPNLETAERDGRAVADLLQTRYGFDVTVLSNATYDQVLTAFGQLREELGEDDNLLVYYAGHGELDERTGLGYWLLADAEPEDDTNWMSSRVITDQLSTMQARHVLVMADSCYAGALTGSSLVRFDGNAAQKERWRRERAERRSRTALTSGGLQPVLEPQGGEHSIFARSVIEVLSDNGDILDTQRLWTQVRSRVRWQTRNLQVRQSPEYAPIRYAGHESGEFFFVPVS